MPHSPLDISEQEIRKRCGQLLDSALEEASRLRHNYIGTEHLFNGLSQRPNSLTSKMLIEEGLEPREFRNLIRREVGAGDDMVSERPPITPRLLRALAMAVYLADDTGERYVTEPQALLALLQEGEGVAARMLVRHDVDLVRWIERLLKEMDDQDVDNVDDFLMSGFDSSLDVNLDEKKNRMPTPLLDKYGRDLLEQAKLGKIGPAVGREMEIRMIARTLRRSKKNNPLLLGDSGVGKTAVVEGLAYDIAHGTAPRFLLGRRIVGLEIGMLVAGTSLRGQFEERIIGIVDEVKNAPDVILFIDEIHTIVGAGDSMDSNLDAANILKPALARGDITCIGATTFEEYRKAIAKDPALDRRFRTIDIDEQGVADTLNIVEYMYTRYEDHHKVKILPEAREASVRLSDRYIRDRRLPDKALDLLDEACARVVIQTNVPDQTDNGDGSTAPLEVTGETITQVLSEWTGIPVSELTANERQRFAHIEDSLRKRVIGQDQALRVVSDAIKTNRAGLGDPKRPVGVFLFLGPSGVGKTELAKALAEFLFNEEDAMIRLDMSEFHDEHTVARLIGAPPGYKGMEQGGQLTEALRRKPYSVVLLDEVEKAATEVFDIFLQVFDEGRLTDSQGATVDGRHACWIMTSNIGTGDVGKGLGFTAAPDQLPDYDHHLKKHFRPEFLNRLDDIVIFNALSREALDDILNLQMADVIKRLSDQKLTIRLDESARQLLLAEGYDPAYGARPLRRAIQQHITRPLSTAILEDTFGAGDTIKVVAQAGALVFQKVRRAEKNNSSDSLPPEEAISGVE